MPVQLHYQQPNTWEKNLLKLELDNADAFKTQANGTPSSILKGPMFEEIKRRREE